VIEDRGSQITYSALGQQAPLEEKEKWDPDFAKRKKIKRS
jgi:phosphomannomutase